jgi:serine/threonine protein kinase
VVFRAREKRTGRIYALKKIKLERFNDGFPQTSIREINVLLSLHHPNIVNVSEVRRVPGGAGGLGGAPVGRPGPTSPLNIPTHAFLDSESRALSAGTRPPHLP